MPTLLVASGPHGRNPLLAPVAVGDRFLSGLRVVKYYTLLLNFLDTKTFPKTIIHGRRFFQIITQTIAISTKLPNTKPLNMKNLQKQQKLNSRFEKEPRSLHNPPHYCVLGFLVNLDDNKTGHFFWGLKNPLVTLKR